MFVQCYELSGGSSTNQHIFLYDKCLNIVYIKMLCDVIVRKHIDVFARIDSVLSKLLM